MAAAGTVVFRTPWFAIATVDPGPEASGTTAPYYCVLRSNGVICLVLDIEGRVLLVRQYRPPLQRYTLEMPAGSIDPGETPLMAAVREIREESGFECEQMFDVAKCRMALNREDAVEHFCIGLGAAPVAGTKLEAGTVHLVDRHEFLHMVRTGKFEQTVALGGLYAAERTFNFNFLRDDPRAIADSLQRGE